LTDDICPENIIRAVKVSDLSGNVELLPNGLLTPTNLNITSNFSLISYEVLKPVFFKMLLCKEFNKNQKPQQCPYGIYRKEFNNYNTPDKKRMTCSDLKPNKKLAHFYFGFEKPDTGTPNCIVIFVKKGDLFKQDELVQKLINTITWLKITKDFDFRVVPLGQKNSIIENTIQEKRLHARLKKETKCKSLKLKVLNTQDGQSTLSIKHKDDSFLIQAS
jgi:hypothetical protein